MYIQPTELEGVMVLTPEVFEDQRGYFYESYSEKSFSKHGLNYNFVQDNHSYNKKKHTFRGFHYQKFPCAQTTLVRVVSGKIIDLVVDIRQGSPTFGKTISNVLSDKNHKQVLIPEGFAHGFLTLTDNVNMLYKMDSLYSSEHDRILNFNDPALSIDLGVAIDSIVIADKDKNAPYLNDIDNNFYL